MTILSENPTKEKKTFYDIATIRQDFPILSRQIHGKPLVYLDNAASAQKPSCVLDRITRTYAHEYANVHRGLHTLSNGITESYEQARATTARFLGAPSPDTVVFTRSATEAINLVASSYGADHFQEGDEIVLSLAEHHANIIPWHFHRQHRGVRLKWCPITPEGAICLDQFEALLTERTKMVAITHVSNVTGSVMPIKQISRRAHARGIPVLVDGAQAAVHMPVDVQELECDFYVITGHKLYGPTGIGALYAKKDYLDTLRPFNGGGEMIETVTCTNVTYSAAPQRFEAGTPPIVQAIGLAEALRYIESIGRENIMLYEKQLRDAAWEKLRQIDRLRILGETPDKAALFSFDIEGIHPHDISVLLDQMGIAIRAGTHCAQPLLSHFGLTASCRASFALYNTLEEVDHLYKALLKVLTFFPKGKAQ